MANRLAQESSPYLKQHDHNPVDWYPWGEEALSLAKKNDKPILLSVGYSACHWCHVMAHESFENPATAELMNKHFINVKVDREERPDVDQLYQGVVQLMGRGGGWPLTVFLTPDLRPFYGGTYFPPENRHGLPAFTLLLRGLADAYANKRSDIEEQAENFKAGLTQYCATGLDAKPSTLEVKDIVDSARLLAGIIDPAHGGFGKRGPKFPNPMNLALMLRGWRRSREKPVLDGVLLTLEKMARGGIYDQLGGGFSRYSVDERWAVPHFEKMLYDNAQLLHLYSEAQQIEPRPLWKKVVEETVEYLQREMVSAEGAFYAAQDADSEGEEGKFFAWTPQQLVEVLGKEDGAKAAAHFGVDEEGNFEHGTSVLSLQDLGELPEIRQKLFAARSKRIPPGRDDKVLLGWNGLMLRGLAYGSRVFGRPEWAAMAAKAADFLLAKLRRPDGTLFRSWQGGAPKHVGMIEDYGDFASGLCALYQATFDPKYLEAAEALSDVAVQQFWDDAKQAYLAAPHGQSDLLVPTYALHDNAFPSGASTLTEAQVALAALTGRVRHLDQARKYLERTRTESLENPMGYGHLMLAADSLLDGAADLTVIDLPQLAAVPSRVFAPTVHVALHQSKGPVPKVLAETLDGKTKPGAYLCRNFSCLAPVATEQEVEALIAPA
jgi:uncharacterized protein YyaL (SSP411 family)